MFLSNLYLLYKQSREIEPSKTETRRKKCLHILDGKLRAVRIKNVGDYKASGCFRRLYASPRAGAYTVVDGPRTCRLKYYGTICMAGNTTGTKSRLHGFSTRLSAYGYYIFTSPQNYSTQNEGMQPQLVLTRGIMSTIHAFRHDSSVGTITQRAEVFYGPILQKTRHLCVNYNKRIFQRIRSMFRGVFQ